MKRLLILVGIGVFSNLAAGVVNGSMITKSQTQMQYTQNSAAPVLIARKEITRSEVINKLQSQNSMNRLWAAKYIYKRYNDELKMTDLVDKEILKNYETTTKNKYEIDALAWMCKTLGISGRDKYKNTLQTVAQRAKNQKLRKYGKFSLDLLM